MWDDIHSDPMRVTSSDHATGYDYWMQIDPMGTIPGNPYRSGYGHLWGDFAHNPNDLRSGMPVEPGVLLSKLYWAVPALVVAIGAGFLLGGVVAGF